MSAKRMKYDREFREGAVRIVNETNKPIAAVARDLGVNEGTLGNWVARDREARQETEGLSKGDIEELKRLRGENAALRMERDVLKRSVVPMAGLAAGTLPRASVGRSPGRAMGQRAHHPRQPGGKRRCDGGAAQGGGLGTLTATSAAFGGANSVLLCLVERNQHRPRTRHR